MTLPSRTRIVCLTRRATLEAFATWTRSSPYEWELRSEGELGAQGEALQSCLAVLVEPSYAPLACRTLLDRSSRGVGAPVLVVVASPDAQREAALMAAGASDVVTAADADGLRRAVARLERSRASAAEDSAHGADCHALFELAADALLLVAEGDERIVEGNGSASELFGYPREDLLNLRWRDLGGESLSELLAEAKGPSLAQQRRRSGASFPAEVLATTIVWQGEPTFLVTVRDISERLARDEAARESRRRMASILGNLPGMAYRCASTSWGDMEYVSPGCETLTGYRVDELCGPDGPSYLELIVASDRERVRDELAIALQQRRTAELRYRIVAKDGHERLVLDRGEGVYERGEEVAFEGFVQDVTELERQQLVARLRTRRLHASERLYRLPTVSMALYYETLLRELVALSESESGELHLRSSTGSWACMARVSPTGETGFAAEALERGELPRIPLIVNEPDPRIQLSQGLVHTRILVIPVLGRADRVEGMALLANRATPYGSADAEQCAQLASGAWRIAEARQAEASLRESEARIRGIIEALPDYLVLISASGELIELPNHDWKSPLAVVESPRGRRLHELLPTPSADTLLNGVQRALRTQDTQRLNFETERATQRRQWEARVVASGTGTALAIMRDVSERVSLERELQALNTQLESRVAARTIELARANQALERAMKDAESASRAKSAFLVNMSHEIRTPLNAVLGYSQMLVREEALRPEQREQVAAQLRAAQHLLTLVDNLLELTNMESESGQIARTAFDLWGIIDELRLLSEAQSVVKSLEFVLETSLPRPCPIWTDQGKLRHVFANLLHNAVKFTEHGSVRWRLRIEPRGGEMLLLSDVIDSGPGLDPGASPEHFMPFERTATGIRTGGAGLGLAVVRHLLRALGGQLGVAANSGRGCHFRVQVPVELADERAIARRLSGRVVLVKLGERAPRVLIVGERQGSLQAVVADLEAVGMLVNEVNEREQAKRTVAWWKPDVVMIDLELASKQAIAVEAFRAPDEEGRVLIGCSSQESSSGSAARTGYDAEFRLPMSADALIEGVAQAIRADCYYAGADGEVERVDELDPGLLRQRLQRLPPEHRVQLERAVRAANFDEVLAQIAAIAQADPQSARQLRNMAEQFDYASILASLSVDAR